jgi:hypothetical protein
MSAAEGRPLGKSPCFGPHRARLRGARVQSARGSARALVVRSFRHVFFPSAWIQGGAIASGSPSRQAMIWLHLETL